MESVKNLKQYLNAAMLTKDEAPSKLEPDLHNLLKEEPFMTTLKEATDATATSTEKINK